MLFLEQMLEIFLLLKGSLVANAICFSTDHILLYVGLIIQQFVCDLAASRENYILFRDAERGLSARRLAFCDF